jgi:hypothetical protein
MMIREMELMKTIPTMTKKEMMMASVAQLQREVPSGE